MSISAACFREQIYNDNLSSLCMVVPVSCYLSALPLVQPFQNTYLWYCVMYFLCSKLWNYFVHGPNDGLMGNAYHSHNCPSLIRIGILWVSLMSPCALSCLWQHRLINGLSILWSMGWGVLPLNALYALAQRKDLHTYVHIHIYILQCKVFISLKLQSFIYIYAHICTSSIGYRIALKLKTLPHDFQLIRFSQMSSQNFPW